MVELGIRTENSNSNIVEKRKEETVLLKTELRQNFIFGWNRIGNRNHSFFLYERDFEMGPV